MDWHRRELCQCEFTIEPEEDLYFRGSTSFALYRVEFTPQVYGVTTNKHNQDFSSTPPNEGRGGFREVHVYLPPPGVESQGQYKRLPLRGSR